MVLGDLKAAIDAISGHGITATIVGNGIHLKRFLLTCLLLRSAMSVVTQRSTMFHVCLKLVVMGTSLKGQQASDADDYFEV